MKKLVKKAISFMIALLIVATAVLPITTSASGPILDNASASELLEYINSNYGQAELDTNTNTIKLLGDIDSFEFALLNIKEDIIFDLNGYTVRESIFSIEDDSYNTITFKDSVGGGKIIGYGASYGNALTVTGKIKLIFESGTYIGGKAFLFENEIAGWFNTSSSALYIDEYHNEVYDEVSDVSIEIKGGTFIGGNGLDRRDLSEEYIANAAPAIEINKSSAATLKVSENAIIKGGDGDNSQGGAGIKIGSEAVVNAIEINGAQITGGNGTVGGDAICSGAAVNLKLTDVTLTAGAPGGKEINVPDGSNVEKIKTPTNIDHTEQGVNVKAADGVFPKNTAVTVTPLTKGDMVDKANVAFGEKFTDFRLYDISAKLNDSAVQPNGEVIVTFDIPENFNIEKTSVYYIDGNGATQKLESQINAETRTIVAKLTHFSAYAVVDESEKQTAVSSSTETVSNNSVTVDSSETNNVPEQTTSQKDESVMSEQIENSSDVTNTIDDAQENVLEDNSSDNVGTSFYESESSNNKVVVIIGIAAAISCLLAVGVVLIIKKKKGKNI